MALILKDRVQETSTTTGTGTLTLAGAVTQFQTFSSAVGNGNTTYYTIYNAGGTQWEVGVGTVGAGTLARTTVLASSNAGAAVNFTGTLYVFGDYPADKAIFANAAGNIENASLTAPKINLINDTNGNEILGLSPTSSATDYLVVKNGIGVGVPLHIYADGSSANTGLHIQPKGTGLVTISDGTDFNKGIRFRSSGSATSVVTLLDAVATTGRVVTLPDATTTLVGRDTTDTLTNKTISGSTNTLSNIANASLTNSAITINGTSTSLGGSISVGTVTSVTGTSPIVSSGGATPAISMPAATGSVNGYLTSTDWTTFNSKGSGSVTSVGGTGTVNGISLTGTITSSGSLTLGGTLSGVSLTTQVSGTLPVGNGGTGLTSPGANGNVLTSNGTAWVSQAGGAGDVVGPASATANGIALFNGTTGKLLKNSSSTDGLINGLTVGKGTSSKSENTAFGVTALAANDTGNSNTAVGVSSLTSNTTGNNNTAIGRQSLLSMVNGSSNTAIGNNALVSADTSSNNVACGATALQSVTTGSGNTALNPRTSSGIYAPVFDPGTENNRFCMGSTAVTNAYIQVAWTVVSDVRDKTNFSKVPHGLDFITQIEPTTYRYKINRDTQEGHGPLRYGFKAQQVLEIEKAFGSAVIVDDEDEDKLKFNDQSLLAVMVNAIKELNAKLELQATEIAILKGK